MCGRRADGTRKWLSVGISTTSYDDDERVCGNGVLNGIVTLKTITVLNRTVTSCIKEYYRWITYHLDTNQYLERVITVTFELNKVFYLFDELSEFFST